MPDVLPYLDILPPLGSTAVAILIFLWKNDPLGSEVWEDGRRRFYMVAQVSAPWLGYLVLLEVPPVFDYLLLHPEHVLSLLTAALVLAFLGMAAYRFLARRMTVILVFLLTAAMTLLVGSISLYAELGNHLVLRSEDGCSLKGIKPLDSSDEAFLGTDGKLVRRAQAKTVAFIMPWAVLKRSVRPMADASAGAGDAQTQSRLARIQPVWEVSDAQPLTPMDIVAKTERGWLNTKSIILACPNGG